MAISSRQLVYDVKRKLNALTSGKATDFRVIDVVREINASAEEIIQNLIHEEDQNRGISNHLRPLFIKKKELVCESVDKDCCKFTYPDNHYATSNIVVEACHDCCKDTKRIPVQTLQSDDLQTARLNPYRRANFFFEQLIGDEAHDGYYIYHDCEMDIKSVKIDYYRKFKGIQAPSLVESCGNRTYKDWDGNLITEDCDFELCDTYLHNKVTDVAAARLAGASRDYNFANYKFNEINTLQNIHR